MAPCHEGMHRKDQIMGLDDRDWMRRESEERRAEGWSHRQARRGFRLNVLHLFSGLVFLIVLVVAWPSLRLLVDRLIAPPADESSPLADVPAHSPSVPPSPAIAHQPALSVEPNRRSLRDCLNGGNVIDESVIRCQNGGELPSKRNPQSNAEPRGMVSPEYLAKFQAERNQRISQHGSTRNIAQERDSKWIKSWDGSSSYVAEWVVVNNVIDGGIVCGNHRWGSIEYRECRKGAKVFFREQCRAWGDRAARDRKEWSFKMKDRYCTAESSFSPMG